mmetsp:Transcript_5899/g.7733  ORF Transcript_5899/g.7733 Transcript_5899/m.7733 type:complete len:225 (-) Transcript_5899:515-1189(-)
MAFLPKYKPKRKEFRIYSTKERSQDLSVYKPFSMKLVVVDEPAEVEEKPEILFCMLSDIFDDLSLDILNVDLETEWQSKGFGPGEGFPDGFIYFAWDLKNPKVKVSAVDYIHFIMEWANAILDDKRIFVEEVDEKFLPELERDIVKPICERILHVYAILFHYHTQNPVHSYDRFYVECAFDRFIYISLYWGLIDFNGETAKYLQEQIDIPRKSYLQAHARDTYI